jgi:hypothetical protein
MRSGALRARPSRNRLTRGVKKRRKRSRQLKRTRLLSQNLTLSIPQTVKDDVSAIVNKRYDQVIHGPSGDLFLSGFYLDPGMIKLALYLVSN